MCLMISTFKHKGLEALAATGDASKLPVKNHKRVARILTLLNIAAAPEDMNIPGFRFHGLQGTPKRYAVDASGNYRITFGWNVADAIDVNIEDYH